MTTAPITLLYCPFPSLESARAAATALLEARAVACCNLLPAAESLYWWEGKLAANPEIILIAKTTAESATAARALLARNHPYDCPAILSIAADANDDYAAWVAQNIAGMQGSGTTG